MIRTISDQPELHRLSETGNPQRPTQNIPDQPTVIDKRDSLELSEQAQELLRNPDLAKRQQIAARIESGFYNSPEVLHTVAQRLLESLDKGASPAEG